MIYCIAEVTVMIKAVQQTGTPTGDGSAILLWGALLAAAGAALTLMLRRKRPAGQ